MKSIGIFLLISLCVHSMVVKRYTKNEMLEDLNKKRAKLAVAGKIANMHELSWDSNFAKQARQLECEDFGKDRANQVAIGLFDDETNKRLDKLSDDQKREEKKYFGYQAFWYPEQTHIGCATLNTPCSSNEGAVLITVTGMCLIGPKTDVGNIFTGEPGSKCPGKTTKDGLCKAGGSSAPANNEPVLLDMQNWAGRMNKHRADYAKAYNIARMYELTWDPELAKKASKLDCEKFFEPGPDYRAMVLVDQATDMVIHNLPDEERDKEMDGIGFNGMRIPGQTRIGCADLDIPCGRGTGLVKKIIGVCLIGPETEFGDVKIGAFGSKCPNGKGSHGLCKALPKGVKPKDDDDDSDGESEEEKEENSSGSNLIFLVFVYFMWRVVFE